MLNCLKRKITSNKSKHLLVENGINRPKKLSLENILDFFFGEDDT